MDPLGLTLQRSALAATGRRSGPAGARRATLHELRASLSGLAALHDAERWAETSDALAALGRQLGALLPLAARPSGSPQAAKEPESVHLVLQDPMLMALPWELAMDPAGRYLFAPGSACLIRGEAGLRSPRLGPRPGPLAVTLLAEEPIHFGLANLSASVAAIRETFQRGRPDAPGNQTSLAFGNLGTEPTTGRPTQVLHLLGHGYETSGLDARFEYGMHCASLRAAIPEDAYGEAPAGHIAEALARHAPVETLLLDACYTGGGFRWDGNRWRDPLCTHAARLGCSVVVSFFDAMKIAKARDFARSFYDGLLAGEAPLAAAVAAREALYLAEVGIPLHECAWWRVRIEAGAPEGAPGRTLPSSLAASRQ